MPTMPTGQKPPENIWWLYPPITPYSSKGINSLKIKVKSKIPIRKYIMNFNFLFIVSPSYTHIISDKYESIMNKRKKPSIST
jgi:hypothetical protein